MEMQLDMANREVEHLLCVFDTKEMEYNNPYVAYWRKLEVKQELVALKEQLDAWQLYQYKVRAVVEILNNLQHLGERMDQRATEAENRRQLELEAKVKQAENDDMFKQEQLKIQAELQEVDKLVCDIRTLFISEPYNNGYERFLGGLHCLFEEKIGDDHLKSVSRVSTDMFDKMLTGANDEYQLFFLNLEIFGALKVFEEMPNNELMGQFEVNNFSLGFYAYHLAKQYLEMDIWPTGVGTLLEFIGVDEIGVGNSSRESSLQVIWLFQKKIECGKADVGSPCITNFWGYWLQQGFIAHLGDYVRNNLLQIIFSCENLGRVRKVIDEYLVKGLVLWVWYESEVLMELIRDNSNVKFGSILGATEVLRMFDCPSEYRVRFTLIINIRYYGLWTKVDIGVYWVSQYKYDDATVIKLVLFNIELYYTLKVGCETYNALSFETKVLTSWKRVLKMVDHENELIPYGQKSIDRMNLCVGGMKIVEIRVHMQISDTSQITVASHERVLFNALDLFKTSSEKFADEALDMQYHVSDLLNELHIMISDVVSVAQSQIGGKMQLRPNLVCSSLHLSIDLPGESLHVRVELSELDRQFSIIEKLPTIMLRDIGISSDSNAPNGVSNSILESHVENLGCICYMLDGRANSGKSYGENATQILIIVGTLITTAQLVGINLLRIFVEKTTGADSAIEHLLLQRRSFTVSIFHFKAKTFATQSFHHNLQIGK